MNPPPPASNRVRASGRHRSIDGRGAGGFVVTPALCGEVRNLPPALAGGVLNSPIALAVMNPQDGFDDGGIGRVPMLALRRVAEGGWVIGVEPDTTVGDWD